MRPPSFAKILAIGNEYITDIFKSPVEITEKIDGSMFAFGCTQDGHVVMRSKGKELFYEDHTDMFKLAVQFVMDHEEFLLAHPGIYFYGEFLSKPKHNALAYDRVPRNNIVLFGVYIEEVGYCKLYKELKEWANALDLDPVPLLYYGEIKDKEQLERFLTFDSILGNQKVEGIVVKNYEQTLLVGGKISPQFGKLVRPEFKEKLNKTWTTGKDKVQVFIDSFRTEARWQKAVQHLKDKGQLEGSPRDIGKLIVELKRDIIDEEENEIKLGLYKLFKDQILRKAGAGFPEWFKEQLLNKQFED